MQLQKGKKRKEKAESALTKEDLHADKTTTSRVTLTRRKWRLARIKHTVPGRLKLFGLDRKGLTT